MDLYQYSPEKCPHLRAPRTMALETIRDELDHTVKTLCSRCGTQLGRIRLVRVDMDYRPELYVIPKENI